MFNRTSTKDVFDRITQPDDPVDVGAADKASDTETALSTTEFDSDSVDGPTIGPDGPTTDETAAQDDEAAIKDDNGEQTPSSHRPLIRRTVAAVGVVAFVAALGLAGFFGWQLKLQRDTAAAGRTALEVARNYAVILTSVDNAKIDENYAQVLEGATGEFKDMYSQSATQLRQLLIDNKANSHGTVVDAAIKSATNDKVEVLLFIDQSISNIVNPEPRIDRSRVAITMEHIDNRWLASKVDII